LNVKITSGHKEELEDSALLLDSDYSNPQQDAERQVPTEIVINVIKLIPFGACFDGLGCCVTNRTTHSAGLLFGSLGPFFFRACLRPTMVQLSLYCHRRGGCQNPVPEKCQATASIQFQDLEEETAYESLFLEKLQLFLSDPKAHFVVQAHHAR
jgi:hypothetical protein